MQKQLLKNYCWLWTKKVTNFMAHKKRLPNFGPKFWALILGQPPQSKLKFRLISIQFDYTPFHGCFLCGCIFIFVRLPYFDWKKCNFHHKNAISISGRYYIAIFEKTGKKKRKITQNNKNATLPLYVFCLPKQNEFFVGLF